MEMVESWPCLSYFLDDVEWDAGDDSAHTEAVAQAFGGDVRPVDTGSVHDGVDGAPAGHAKPPGEKRCQSP